MKRRESLKALTLSSLAGLTVTAPVDVKPPQTPVNIPGGRTKKEAIRDAKLMSEKYFTDTELQTIRILCDIIIPADAHSGSASQAKVPEFIEFMAKDIPSLQTPLTGGLQWINQQSNKRFGKAFALCTAAQRIEIVDDIAYPEQAKPEMSQGVAFFNLMRNLTAAGFFSSQMGIKDIGYMGNTPNQWDGVPEDVLKQYGLSY
ncbi:gluconate 2-dehydrogenase subunit 3 family protein [Cytophagaceae bacterium YF14B1]|uniref:Gluconate 2-dehydrogenase subunit 3 family protein n=1 Tax=Xanthocytophaga flava TaxID=3048013 RepID=A0AAE3UC56_9BACT|nr:gluconate 2-dehydrogenase subunit 3 family protein [Xanthocytophaga flavus]MDJ1484414.1 gluconate 2-dehydrogenase subunit 3 family protein [Xanthocytophaga flavus]